MERGVASQRVSLVRELAASDKVERYGSHTGACCCRVSNTID
jgi:hypothetical protein